MTIEELYGVWNLVSIHAENADGARNYYFGENAQGRLTYLREGYMSAFLMRPGRRKLSGGIEGTPEETQEAFEGFEAYSGTYTVDLEAGIVTHHVDLARVPNYEGTDQVRYFSLEDGILSIYSAPVLVQDEEWVVYVKWEKLS